MISTSYSRVNPTAIFASLNVPVVVTFKYRATLPDIVSRSAVGAAAAATVENVMKFE